MADRNGKHTLPETDLEALFGAARDADRVAAEAGELGLPPGLSARILSDADSLQEARASEAQRARAAARHARPGRAASGLGVAGLMPAAAGMGGGFGGGLAGGPGGPGGGFWAQLTRALGGGPALAGLGAVAIAGLWVGVMPPEALATPLDSLFGASLDSNPYLVDATTAYDFLDSEG